MRWVVHMDTEVTRNDDRVMESERARQLRESSMKGVTRSMVGDNNKAGQCVESFDDMCFKVAGFYLGRKKGTGT